MIIAATVTRDHVFLGEPPMRAQAWAGDIFVTPTNYLRFDPSDRCNSDAANAASVSTEVGGLP